MAMAVLLPLSFFLEPLIGIPFLIGVYKGGIFGGSIPAILIKTPGTPASSATILDGHPMAERGEAGRALGGHLERCALALAQGLMPPLGGVAGPARQQHERHEARGPEPGHARQRTALQRAQIHPHG